MRAEKKSIFEEFKSRTADSSFLILTDYRGLTVSKTEELRKRLRGVNARFQVIQNRIFKQVVKDSPAKGLEPALKGPSAMVYGSGDVVMAAKALKEFIKENEKPVVKMAVLDGAVITAADVEKLAGLPSREILLGKFLGTLAAPMTQLVGVLQQKVASILYVLKAVEEKKSKA